MLRFLFNILNIFCLVTCILLSGVVLCVSTPQITSSLSNATCLVDKAKFTRDQLTYLANTCREFISGECDKTSVYSSVETINKQSQTTYKDLTQDDFAAVNDQYSLDINSVSHLSDVAWLIANIRIAFFLSLTFSIAFSILLAIFGGFGSLSRSFKIAALLVLLLILGLVIWSFNDFNGMFNFIHSLFFSKGSWVFSENSLLICMFPESFWILMAIICGAISGLVSIILLITSKFLR